MGLRGIGARPLSLRPSRRRQAWERANGERQCWQAPGFKIRWHRVVSFLEDLTITSGTESGTKLKLRGFQKEFLSKVYAVTDGKRLVRTAVLSMARKNGKTQLAAALALCHLCGPESESRGEVYSCANDRFQSGKIFNEMVAMIDRHDWLRLRCNILMHRKEIRDLHNESMFAALSKESRTKMGLSPTFVIYDELGSAPNDQLYRAMDSAMGARKEPLMMVISTQAADDFAPMSRLVDYGIAVRSGEIKDPSFHLDLHCAQETDDPWAKATWDKANPALGDFRSLEDVERQANQARRMPAQENSFRNLILNMRVAAEARFIERSTWQACGGEPSIPLGARVYAGVDLGSTRDMSALVLIHQDADGLFHVKPWYWLPGEPQQRSDEDRVPYVQWHREGLLDLAGAATDPRQIAVKIAELNGMYRIQTLAFDRWRIGELKRELDDIGCNVPMVPHGQGFKEMSPAVDVLERLVVQQRVRHGNHPILAMNAANAVIARDPAGGRKLDKAKSSGRIDGLVAAAMAFNIALVRSERAIDIEALIA